MADNRATYPEYRHTLVARYGHFRIDRVWTRTALTDEHEVRYYRVVFGVDASSEFDLGTIRPEVPSPSEMLRDAIHWLRVHRPTPEGGLVSLACFRRRIGPPDGEYEATPGEWYARDSSFRRPGKPMINMHEAVPLVEVALHDLEEAERQGLGPVF